MGDVIFREGDIIWDVYHVVEGCECENGVEVRQQWKGASFGPLTVTGKLVANRSRDQTIVCIIDCVLSNLLVQTILEFAVHWKMRWSKFWLNPQQHERIMS